MTTKLDDLLNVSVYDNKYTVIQRYNGQVDVLRYGEPWMVAVDKGSSVILALASEVERLRKLVNKKRS